MVDAVELEASTSRRGTLIDRVRAKVVSALIEIVLRTLSALGKLHPYSWRIIRGVEVLRNIRYAEGAGPARLLNVYRPRGQSGPLPVAVYIHGGGFRILSKDTHWMFGHELAMRGYVVFSINYRLAVPFPNGLEDVVQAIKWIGEHAPEYGGDLEQLVYAGESAGANLASALMIMHCWRRPEPYAQAIWDLPIRPKIVLPTCGMLEVSHAERYLGLDSIPRWMRDRIRAICNGYLPDTSGDPDRFALADPVRFLETAPPPERPLPGIFSSCGTKDPVLDDSRRLERALSRFDGDFEVRFYEGGVHSFQAFVFSELAQRAWSDQDAFCLAHGFPSSA